jgi:hypothetical protein
MLQQFAGLQSDGLQSEGLHFCSVLHLFFFTFLGLRSVAKAPVASEHTMASMIIFFIMLFLNFFKMNVYK